MSEPDRPPAPGPERRRAAPPRAPSTVVRDFAAVVGFLLTVVLGILAVITALDRRNTGQLWAVLGVLIVVGAVAGSARVYLKGREGRWPQALRGFSIGTAAGVVVLAIGAVLVGGCLLALAS